MSDFDEPETTDHPEPTSAPDHNEPTVDTEGTSTPEHSGPTTVDTEEIHTSNEVEPKTVNAAAASASDDAEPARSNRFDKLTNNKIFSKADGTLNKVTGIVADKAGPKKKIVAFAIIGIALILVIAVVAVVLSGGGSSVNSPPYDPDVFDDPEIQGDLGIGTLFVYSTGDSGPVELRIVGQSGSYYLLDVGTLSAYIGNDTQYQMFHKTNGGLRFGTQIGTDTYTYGGKEIKLDLWTVIDSSDDVWTLGVSPADGIPYKIKAVCDDKVVEAKLTGIQKTSPSTYTKPSGLDKYYKYSLGGSIDGSDASGAFAAGTAAEASGVYWSAFIIDAEVNGHGAYRQVEYYAGSDLLQMLYENFTADGEADKDGQNVITTLDGYKTCDVYKLVLGDVLVMESFIEPSTKIVYRSTLSVEDDHYTLTLKQKHI
jgi:hypothetical protein